MLLSPLLSLHYKRKHALGTHAQDQVQPWLRRDLSTVVWHNFDVWYLMFVCLFAKNIHMLLSPLLSQLTTNASMHWAFTHKIKCNHDCTVGLHNFYLSYLVFLFVCFLWIKLLPKYPHASFSSPLLALKNASMNCTGHSCTIKCNYEFAGMSEKLVGTNFCIVYYL